MLKLDRRLVTILLIVFVQMLGASMVLPILPLYAQRRFAMEPQVITLLLTTFFAAQFVAGPWIGRLSDKYGRVPVLIVSQIGTAISFAMIGFAESVAILFIARLFDGITGGNVVVAQAYVTDITKREDRTKALGYIFAAFGMGFVFGPALGGVLSAAFGPTVPFILAAIAAAAVVVLTWFTLDETLTPEQRAHNRAFRQSLNFTAVWNNYFLMVVLLVVFVGQFGLGLLQSTFALYGGAVLFADATPEVTDLGIGLLLSVVGLTQVFTQSLVLPRLTRRYADTTLIVAGALIRTIGLTIFAIVTSPWLGGFGSFFFALGMGVMMPPLQAYTTHVVADELRGGVLGLYQSAVSLATIFSTALGGLLFAISPTTPYWLAAGLSLIAIIPVVTLLRQPVVAVSHKP
ncbi:MAG: MFS transporter [Chloroflexi bacterium]|nr:MFS transporter [Chloroflexota bacterium]